MGACSPLRSGIEHLVGSTHGIEIPWTPGPPCDINTDYLAPNKTPGLRFLQYKAPVVLAGKPRKWLLFQVFPPSVRKLFPGCPLLGPATVQRTADGSQPAICLIVALPVIEVKPLFPSSSTRYKGFSSHIPSKTTPKARLSSKSQLVGDGRMRGCQRLRCKY